MKVTTKFFMVALILSLLLTVSAVAAAEDISFEKSDTKITNGDTSKNLLSTDNNEDNLKTNEITLNDETLSAKPDDNKLGNGQYTYSDLRNQIGNGRDITLNKGTYTYNSSDGQKTITISNSCTIDGNGSVIDMKGSTIRAFYITAEYVTIKNLTIKNANFNGKGGAICFADGKHFSSTFINCNFINNTANDGGAIYSLLEDSPNSPKCTVINCNFTNNTASDGYGGAIYSDGCDITNCSFINNTAYWGGGAIDCRSGTAKNCNFNNNKATRIDGGAVFAGRLNVFNCNFTNNIASDGGALIVNWEFIALNCNFINNKATGDGGAIRTRLGNVENCTFTNNTATDKGGAVYFYEEGSVVNCDFINNKATSGEGGAIAFIDYQNIGSSVVNCNLVNNSASKGGAINFDKYGTVTNCNFTNNSASSDGGAIRFVYSGSIVKDCSFNDNFAKYGGAISFENSGSVENCDFVTNDAGKDNGCGGAIYFRDDGYVTDCNFTANTALDKGGAIHFDNPGNAINCNFIDNSASGGGAVYIDGGSEVLNCNFTGNNAISGSAIYLTASGANNIYNSSFLNNRANAEDLVVVQNENNIAITFIGGNNLLNAIYSYDDAEVTFANVTYWGENGIMNTDAGKYSISNNESGQNITVIGIVNGNVINTIKSTDASGKIVLEGISGDYYLTISHDEDSYYTMVDATVTNIEDYTVTIISQTTNNKIVNITAKSDIYREFLPGDLTFIFENGDLINANYANNGTWWLVYEFADYAQYNVDASYDGLEGVTINNANITIERLNSTLTVNDIVFDYGGSGSTTVNFTNALGINASVIGQPNAIVNVVNNTITVSGLDAGTYTLNVTTIVDDDHNPVTQTANITVNKIKTELDADAITATYNINKYLTITLNDINGNPLKGIGISVDLNGVKKYTTDANGQVKVPTKGLAPKTYTAKITFNGNTNYEKSAKNVKVTVKKDASKITAGKKTFNVKTNVKKYAAVLKDSTGKPIKNVKLTLKVKGKTYAAKTNSKGKAIFKITKLNKKGTFKGVIKFDGNKYYAKSGKNVEITVKASKSKTTFKTVSKGSKDSKTVKKIQQALKNHGYYLTYKGHYLMVDGKFESCTERSVKEFQRDNGLKKTGKVDVKTAKKLGII